MTHDNDQVGAYVLDALELAERQVCEEHLKDCSECQREVRELSSVVDVLTLAIDHVEPPRDLRDRIVAAVNDRDSRPPALTAIEGGRSQPQSRGRRTGWSALLAVAAVLAIAALGTWNLQLRNQVQSHSQTVALQQKIVTAQLQGASVAMMTSTTHKAGVSAQLVIPRGGQHSYLAVQGLPANPTNKVYQVWGMPNGAQGPPVSMGIFHYSGGSTAVVELSGTRKVYPVAGVTLEPGPHGSPAPTSAPVLVGPVRA